MYKHCWSDGPTMSQILHIYPNQSNKNPTDGVNFRQRQEDPAACFRLSHDRRSKFRETDKYLSWSR